ncbi:sulfatase-like hydrolase/transferase [Catenovulum sediminis]|uniref:Sulfatase-like hydrolase/transferase n=1 Tax=Catenovulum sediminis TaxID=1740262 RepID=A0ABV1RDI8_9ALTE
MKQVKKQLFSGILIFACMAMQVAVAANDQEHGLQSKPNFVFILSDDQSFNTLKNMGNTEIVAPNINELAAQGVTFSHAYNMGAWNGAVCLASRAMLNSGRALWNAKALEDKQFHQQRRETTWANLMRKAGYQTYFTGKWHVHLPAQKVFTYTRNVRPGMPADGWNHAKMIENFNLLKAGKYSHYREFMPIGYLRPIQGQVDKWSPTDPKFAGFYQGGTHWSEVVKQDAVKFINQASKQDAPFFMYLAFNAPHEQVDLANDNDQQKRIKKLFAALTKLQKNMNDPLPLKWRPKHSAKIIF